VIDVAPTILEAAGLPAPRTVDGVEQMPIEGTPMNYSFNDAAAEDRHTTQYFEIGGSRGIYHEGWVACAAHRTSPWNFQAADLPGLAEERWELYDTAADWSQARDLADEFPDKLAQLKELFLIEAVRNQVLPLDDRGLAIRRNAEQSGRIESMTVPGTTRRLASDAMPNVINASHVVACEVEVPSEGASGVLCAQGGRFTGWSLYCHRRTLTYCYNVAGKVISFIRASQPLSPGRHQVRYEFAYDGEGMGQGGLGRLLVDGECVAEGRIERTAAFMFPIGEDFNVGIDPLTAVSPEYVVGESAFNGTISWVRIDLGEGPGVTEEDRVRMEMATQ
jgi:arylsulfatase